MTTSTHRSFSPAESDDDASGGHTTSGEWTNDGLDDLGFEPAAGWHRRTFVAFDAPKTSDAKGGGTLTVMREAMMEGETLRSVVRQRLIDLRGLPRLRVVAHEPTGLQGTPAMLLKCEWEGPTGTVVQTSTFVETLEERGAVLTQFTTTCLKKDAPAMRDAFERMLASVSFGRSRRVSQVVPAAPDSEPTLRRAAPVSLPRFHDPEIPSTLPPPPSAFRTIRPPPMAKGEGSSDEEAPHTMRSVSMLGSG